jgi:hypothetical protein
VAIAALVPAPSANAAITHELVGSFPISYPVQIAIDEGTGQVYVFQVFGENGYFEPGIRRFDASGIPSLFSALGTNQVDGCCGGTSDADQTPANGIGSLQNGGPWEFAIDNSPGATQHDLIVPNFDSVFFFDSTGTYLATVKTPIGNSCGATMDPAGSLYVSHGESTQSYEEKYNVVSKYSPGPHTQAAKFKENSHLYPREEGDCNVAADSAGGLYLNRSRLLGIVGGEEEPLLYYSPNLFDLILEDPIEGQVGVFGRRVAEHSGTVSVEKGTDDAYATEGDRVVRYDSAGNEVESFGDGDFEHGVGIAVNAVTGRVYVSNLFGSKVLMYDEVVTPDITGVSAEPGQDTATITAHVAPAGTPTVTECEVEYGPTVSYGTAVPCGGAPYSAGSDVTVGLPGLETEKTYHYRVTATNANGVHEGVDRTFTTHAVVGVTTGEPTGVTRTSATITGSFVGNGEETTAYFEWGKTATYGNSSPATTSTGVGSTPVSAELTELLAYTATSGTYHYRLVASNSKGTSYGEDVLFHTLLPDKPSIESSSAQSVGESGATLAATVNPQGAPAGVRFEYGLTSSLESVAEIGGPLQADSSDHEVSAPLAGLVPGSTYRFRVVASNFAGATIGPELEFHTPSPPAIGDEAVSGVGATEATLRAGVKAGFQTTSYRIEYGPNLGYGSVAAQGSMGGSDNETHVVRGSVSGLSPDSTYHFRAVAHNASGDVQGPDQTFSTGPLPSQSVSKQAKCRKGFAKRHGKCARVRHRRHRHRQVRTSHHG